MKTETLLLAVPCKFCDWCGVDNVPRPDVCFDFDSLSGLRTRNVEHVQTPVSNAS